ncbi:MAG: alkaline phosphatase family protein, partial [Bryobacteraceae bacterium]
MAEGTYASGVTGVTPTITYPSHTTMVTGVWPAKHNILSNQTFDPHFENAGGWYWYADDVRVPTLWQAADKAGIVTASLNWPVTVNAVGIRYLIPEYWRAKTPDDRKLMEAVTRPDGWLRELEEKLGPFTNGSTTTVEADEVRTEYAVEILKEKKPGFMTIHLTALDEAEHETSPFSADSDKTLEELDGMIGRLVAAAMKNDPAAVVAVVSDHGFARTDHRVNLMVPFYEAGLIKPGKRSPVTGLPTVASWEAEPWMAGGTAAIMLHDPNDAATRARVKSMLEKLKADPSNGIARVMEGDAIRKLGGFPDAAFVVELKLGYQLGSARIGALVTPAPSTGMHGYLPDRPEMRAS